MFKKSKYDTVKIQGARDRNRMRKCAQVSHDEFFTGYYRSSEVSSSKVITPINKGSNPSVFFEVRIYEKIQPSTQFAHPANWLALFKSTESTHTAPTSFSPTPLQLRGKSGC